MGIPPRTPISLGRVLDGERGPRRESSCSNAAAGLVVGGMAEDLPAGVAMAEECIDSGAAADALEGLVSASQAAAGRRAGMR